MKQVKGKKGSSINIKRIKTRKIVIHYTPKTQLIKQIAFKML